MRRTARRSRRSRRYDNESTPKVLGRGLLVCAVLAGLGYLAVSLYSGVPGRSYDYVEAIVPETGSLIPHDMVRIGGVRVGQVQGIGSTPDGRGKLELQLKDGTRLPEDTTIRLRGNGLLGSRFVELVPGKSSRMLEQGEPVRGDAQSLTYGVTDVVDTFDRETRGALKPLVGELGKGLTGQGRNVNDALRLGSDAIVRFNVLMDRLLEQPQANAALLPSLDSGLAPLSDNRRELGQLLGVAADAVDPFVTERDELRASLDAAPGTLDAADRGLTSTRRLLTAARSLAGATETTLPDAPAGLRATKALLQEGRRPLRRADALLKAARPAVPGALKITSALRPVLPVLDGILADVVPIGLQVGRYECDIENFGAVYRSMTGFGTHGAEGPAGPGMQFRLQAIGSVLTTALSLPDTTPLTRREGLPAPCTYLSKPYPSVRPGASR